MNVTFSSFQIYTDLDASYGSSEYCEYVLAITYDIIYVLDDDGNLNETLFTSTCADTLEEVLAPYVSTLENVEADASLFNTTRRRRLQLDSDSAASGVSVSATVGLESYDQYSTLFEAYTEDTIGAEIRTQIPEAVSTVFNISNFSIDETATTSALEVEGGAYTITTTDTSSLQWFHFVWPIFIIPGFCMLIALIWSSAVHWRSRGSTSERLKVDDEKEWVMLSYWLYSIDFWSDFFFVVHLDVLCRNEDDAVNQGHLRVLFFCALIFLVCLLV